MRTNITTLIGFGTRDISLGIADREGLEAAEVHVGDVLLYTAQLIHMAVSTTHVRSRLGKHTSCPCLSPT